ncbi:hypothetical protein BdWA1_002834 [Babesia duncani]|uniref:Uncharacterized protein n=1 Tax=Babesia duncani TaxID=323732 RepID=A0AAD9PHX1_9APIC|nr:hypothetical protein BdWA1_003673 [Babesia duncani]KAK2196234.1 hypothetical protein BdWA1_002834 [Babesia duncani]
MSYSLMQRESLWPGSRHYKGTEKYREPITATNPHLDLINHKSPTYERPVGEIMEIKEANGFVKDKIKEVKELELTLKKPETGGTGETSKTVKLTADKVSTEASGDGGNRKEGETPKTEIGKVENVKIEVPLNIDSENASNEAYEVLNKHENGFQTKQFMALKNNVFSLVIDHMNVILEDSIYKPKKIKIIESPLHKTITMEADIGGTVHERHYFYATEIWREYTFLPLFGYAKAVRLDISVYNDPDDFYFSLTDTIENIAYITFIPRRNYVFSYIVDSDEVIYECCSIYPHMVHIIVMEHEKVMDMYANINGLLTRITYRKIDNLKWLKEKNSIDYNKNKMISIDITIFNCPYNSYRSETSEAEDGIRIEFIPNENYVFCKILLKGNPIFDLTQCFNKIVYTGFKRIQLINSLYNLYQMRTIVLTDDRKWNEVVNIKDRGLVMLRSLDLNKIHEDLMDIDDIISSRTKNYKCKDGVLHDAIYSDHDLIWSSGARFISWVKQEYLKDPKMFYAETINRDGDAVIVFFVNIGNGWKKVKGVDYINIMKSKMNSVSLNLIDKNQKYVYINKYGHVNESTNISNHVPRLGVFIKDVLFKHNRIWSFRTPNDGICFHMRLRRVNNKRLCDLHIFMPSGYVTVLSFKYRRHHWRLFQNISQTL